MPDLKLRLKNYDSEPPQIIPVPETDVVYIEINGFTYGLSETNGRLRVWSPNTFLVEPVGPNVVIVRPEAQNALKPREE